MTAITRRSFLASSAATFAAAGCSGPADSSEVLAQEQAAVSSGKAAMKLSLSVRVAESFSDKRKTTMTIDQIIAMAKQFGYDALCMRASQAGTHSSAERIAEIRQKAAAAGLPISMVTGDFAVPSNNDDGPMLLRNITPYLDLAESFGANLIRVCIKKDEDLAFARKSADEARERGIRLAHQSHCASLFETVGGALRVLRRVDRPNFGIIYEPANWLIAGEDYGRETIRKLKPYLFNVYIQNHRLTLDGAAQVETWKKGPVRLEHIGVWESGGVNVEEMFAGLHEVGYQGYVTVHQAFGDVMPVEEAVRRSCEYLKPLASGAAV
jgi:sugar phosphate isomerase/epimerase